MDSSQPVSPRLAYLDALRGLAALSVFIYHCLKLLALDIVPFDFGEFGVLLFFFISGCVIPFSLERMSTLQFWIRRFFRLYPAYWFSIICVIILVQLLPESTLALYYQTRPDNAVLLNLTMFHRLLGGLNYDLLPVYWTLFIEMLFYIGVTILVRLRWFDHNVLLAVAGIVLALVVERQQGNTGYEPMRTTMYLATMLTGAVLHRSITNTISSRTLWLVCTLCMIMFLLIPTTPQVLLARLLPLPLLLLVLHYRITPRLLVWFGQLSYAFYLLHEVVMGTIDARNPILNAITWFCVSLLLSMAAYRWIERPSIALARLATNSLGQARLTATTKTATHEPMLTYGSDQ